MADKQSTMIGQLLLQIFKAPRPLKADTVTTRQPIAR